MNTWLTVRTFIAIFLGVFGLGLMFPRSDDMRLMLGALLFSLGAIFLLRMAIELRER